MSGQEHFLRPLGLELLGSRSRAMCLGVGGSGAWVFTARLVLPLDLTPESSLIYVLL